MKILKMHFCLLGLMVSAAASAADYDVKGMSNDVDAGLLLKGWLTDIGYSVESTKARDSVILETEKGQKLVLSPKVSSSGVDRLIIYKQFKGKPSNVNSNELREIINEINAKLNVCTVYLDSDGDLTLRYSVLFDDKISPRLIRISLEHVDTTVSVILERYREKFRPFYE